MTATGLVQVDDGNRVATSCSNKTKVSTQDKKHRIGLDFFPFCIIRTAGPKKLKIYLNSLSSGLRITGSNWNRKLLPKAHAQVQFCSDPARSDAYFPKWKSALIQTVRNKLLRDCCYQLVNELLRPDDIRLAGTTCCESIGLINLVTKWQQLVA